MGNFYWNRGSDDGSYRDIQPGPWWLFCVRHPARGPTSELLLLLEVPFKGLLNKL